VRLALVARNAENLAATALVCTSAGACVAIFPCDVTDASAVAALANAVTQQLGTLDVLINNAGVFVAAPFVDTAVADFDRIIAANLRSAFLVTQAFVPAMIAQKHGDVFFMSSIAGLGAYPNSAAYCAAKFGVTGLAQVLRAETRDHGVRVCCVHPGATWSPSWSASGVSEERIMPAEDVAQAFFDVYQLGRRTVVEEIILRPQLGDL
jgi:NAD(P)-dependent dehydrogenase (short-subunit alcohol dehydrogenase family)